MVFRKLLWIFKRHPFLYRTRFKLLSRNSSIEGINDCNYNQINKINDIPEYFNKINKSLFGDNKPKDDLELVRRLSLWLEENIKGGPGLSESSEKALKTMLDGKGGVCSDMTQIFNNFCVINDIKVREWGVTRAPFDRQFGGHSFNEVFCKEIDKWVLFDISYGVMFYFKDEEPLSVVELYNLIREDKSISYQSFNKIKPLKRDVIDDNFLNINLIPFLICNYSNNTYDKFLNYFKPVAPVFVIHFLIFLLGKSYHYRFPINNYKDILH